MKPFNIYCCSNYCNSKTYLFAYNIKEVYHDQVFGFYNCNYLITQNIIRDHNLWDNTCIYNGVILYNIKLTFEEFYKLYGEDRKINLDFTKTDKTIQTLLEILLVNWDEWN